MADQLVCNIHFFLYIRFFLGFYHEFQTFKLVRWLARCYCCLICANIIFLFLYLHNDIFYPKILMYLLSMEYFMHMVISLLKSNNYLLQYYKKSPLIDVSASAYRQMRVCFVTYICVIFIIRLCGFIKFFISHGEFNVQQYMFSFMDFIIWFTIVIGRSPLIFVFALLYTRIRLMRRMLESNDFDCRNQGKHHPRRYIQMFEAIMDGLKASDEVLKLQVLIFVVFYTIYYFLATLASLFLLRNSQEVMYHLFDVLWFMVEILMNCSPLLLATVLADLVTIEVQEIMSIVLKRRIACKIGRDREEIQQLFQFLKSYPFKYSVWRVLPLNVRSLLSFFSFTVTTIIAILQIQAWTT